MPIFNLALKRPCLTAALAVGCPDFSGPETALPLHSGLFSRTKIQFARSPHVFILLKNASYIIGGINFIFVTSVFPS